MPLFIICYFSKTLGKTREPLSKRNYIQELGLRAPIAWIMCTLADIKVCFNLDIIYFHIFALYRMPLRPSSLKFLFISLQRSVPIFIFLQPSTLCPIVFFFPPFLASSLSLFFLSACLPPCLCLSLFLFLPSPPSFFFLSYMHYQNLNFLPKCHLVRILSCKISIK